MKLKFVVTLFILIVSSFLFAQSGSNAEDEQSETAEIYGSSYIEPLEIKYGRIYLDKKQLNAKQVKDILKSNPAALSKYKSGQALGIVGLVVGIPSAFVFGWDLGSRIGGGEGNTNMLIAGASGTAIGVILGFVGESQCKAAIKLYNSGSDKATGCRLEYGFTSDGLGLALRF